ncbi:MAG: TetR family transcriptional regulator [Chloroflexi bacterium]|nr:TetR family transcriptional regulator [Chloroflexota bacterium]
MGVHPRDRILEATRALAEREGGRRTVTIGEVAAEAHVSRATVYRYFGDKTALLQTAVTDRGGGAFLADPRARILEAALDVFGERGLHAASLQEIATRAGLTLSGLHWHFKNKDELIAGIAEYMPVLPAIESEMVRATHDDADLEGQLLRIAQAGLGFMARRRAVLRLILFETGIHPDVARLARTHTIGRFFPMLTALFERHAASGTLRGGSARARAQAFIGMLLLLGLLRPAFDDLLDPDDDATLREYARIMVRGVLAVPPGG